jgi:hypothetical protein
MAQAQYESDEAGDDRVVLLPSTGRAIAGLAMLLGFEAVAVASAVLAYPSLIESSILCLACTPLLVIPTWWLARRLVTREPLVIVDEAGITDNSSLLPLGLVRWSEVGDIRLRGGMLLPAAHVVLVDPESVFRRFPRWRRWLCRLGAVLFPGGFAIPLALVGERERRDLVDYVSRRGNVVYS